MNQNAWNKEQSKAIQGLCAVGIMFHHMAQKTCASWVPEEFRVHGLDPFLNVGFLLVGVFFFCSGYGLYKSIKSNPDYLKGFIGSHFRPIILLYLISNYCFYMVGQTVNKYTWFIYAILYLYLAFYISFKRCKTEKKAITLLTGFILLYCVICELLVIGTWCYNTVFLFLAGVIFSKDVDKIIQYIHKKYNFCLFLTLFILIFTFFSANYLNNQIFYSQTKLIYTILHIAAILLQFTAALSFSILIFIINQKVSIKGKIFSFLGSMTLELYLIHVLFVELFSYCFVNLDNEANYYISNLFLYIFAVLGASIVSAYALLWVKRGAHALYVKFNKLFAAIGRDAKKVLVGLLVLVVVVTAGLMIGERAKLSARNEHIKNYTDEKITFVQADGSNFSVYEQGSGEKTILIIKGVYDPCPTLSQKALADELAKEYRVVLIDSLGSGFSSDFTTTRSVQNICSEIHNVAAELGLKKYVLLAEGVSGLYAQYYVDQFASEVEAVIALDAECAGLGRAALAQQRLNLFEYERMKNTAADIKFALARVVNVCGYKSFLWPLYQGLFAFGVGQKDDEVAYSVFFDHWENKAIQSERRCEISNYLETENLQYPAGLKVIDFVSEHRRKSYEKREIDIFEYLDNLCQSQDNHIYITLIDSIYCATNNPSAIRNLISENL